MIGLYYVKGWLDIIFTIGKKIPNNYLRTIWGKT